MELTIKDVEQIALLSQLNLTAEEKDTFARNLSFALNYVDKLQELNTENIEPMKHILSVFNIFRPDVLVPSPDREAMLCNAALVEDGYYKVPKIM